MATVDTERDRLARFANLAGGWLGLACEGVEVGPKGDLRLQSVPDAGAPVGPDLMPLVGDGPAGCALDDSGAGYISEPDAGRVRVLNTCAAAALLAGDVTGSRPNDSELLPGGFTAPRALLFGPRRRLYVADADAVLVVDPATGAITGRWSDVVAGWCLARVGDWIYVLDRGGDAGAGRVRRFTPDGVVDAAFGATVASHPGDPVRMAAADDVLLIVMRTPAGDTVLALHADGSPQSAAVTAAWAAPARDERDAITGLAVTTLVSHIDGIATGSQRVYLVDHAHGDLLSFTLTGKYIGSSRPTHPVCDVWVTGAEVAWSYPRDPAPVLRHELHGAWLRAGTFVCGPLDTATDHARRELRVRFDRVAGGHVQLFTAVTANDVPPSPRTIPLTGAADGSPWSAVATDVDVALVTDPAGPRLFIGGLIGGDGAGTPAIQQIGVSGSRSWLDMLPAVYRADGAESDFLDRYLRLLRSVQEETTQERIDLVRRFDPWTATDKSAGTAGSGALDDLAGWLAIVLDERWPESQRRGVVANAFAAQAIRGTPGGLLAVIEERFPRLRVTISAPAERAHIWSLEPVSLPGNVGCGCAAGGLGFDTMLAAAPAGGAVVGVNAVVDQSTVTGGANAGAPLFADLAHRFHVAVVPDPGRDVATLDTDLRAVIDAEKPAHTVYTLCVATPRARVGVQARIGIDAILAGPPPAVDLDTEPRLGGGALGTVPVSNDEPAPTVVGQIRLGQGRLT